VPGKQVGLITGDIRNVKGIDVWVNSENTNMQMARFFDAGVSGVIRYLGAERDEEGQVKDTIALELAKKVPTHGRLDAAEVFVTSPGLLAKTHGVKRLFHVASVEGDVGGLGYRPIVNVERCVMRALEVADSDQFKSDPVRTILFPLLATGAAKADRRLTARTLLETAVDYFKQNEDSRVETAYFICHREDQLKSCQDFLQKSPDVTPAASERPRPGPSASATIG
jgi:O-acetyl-ADP-ribose deacetylase (regulator of RNase III)